MFRIAAVVAVLMGAVVWGVQADTRDAGACSGPAGYLAIMDADVILEGWVESVVETGESDAIFDAVELTFAVTRGYRGVTEGATVTADGRIPRPGVPVMCPQFPPDIEGKYVIVGLRADDDGILQADAWIMLYRSDVEPVPGDTAYAEAVRVTELVTDKSAVQPVLLPSPSDVLCFEPITFSGERFPEGEYLVREAYGRILGTFEAGPTHAATLTVPATFSRCNGHSEGSLAIWIEVYRVGEGDPFVAELTSLAELALVHVINNPAEDPIDPRLEIVGGSPITCGQEVVVEGLDFVAEPLTVTLQGTSNPVSFNAFPPPHGGTFSFSGTLPIPEEACAAPLASIAVYQAGFERFGHALALVHLETRQTPPGPPDLGNSQPRSSPAVAWFQLAGVAAVIVGASLVVARRKRG